MREKLYIEEEKKVREKRDEVGTSCHEAFGVSEEEEEEDFPGFERRFRSFELKGIWGPSALENPREREEQGAINRFDLGFSLDELDWLERLADRFREGSSLFSASC